MGLIDKNLLPMLLSESGPFNSKDYIFELKVDGFRCIAYLDNETVLKSRNNNDITDCFSELKNLYQSVKSPCVLDGELVIMLNGKPDFNEIQKRTRLKNPYTASSVINPASFVAFDILCLNGKFLNDLPLMERKEILKNCVQENNLLSVSRFIEERGIDFFNIIKLKELEGIVAKKKNSRYYFGKRTKEWLKIKVVNEEDFIICGFYPNKNGYNLILASLKDGVLSDAGTASVVESKPDVETILKFGSINTIKEPVFKDYNQKNVTWIKPELIGAVQFLTKTKTGSLRHPIFKGLKFYQVKL